MKQKTKNQDGKTVISVGKSDVDALRKEYAWEAYVRMVRTLEDDGNVRLSRFPLKSGKIFFICHVGTEEVSLVIDGIVGSDAYTLGVWEKILRDMRRDMAHLHEWIDERM